MKQTFKTKIASLLLAVVMLLSLVPELHAASEISSGLSIINTAQPNSPITTLDENMQLGISGLPDGAEDYTYQWKRSHSDTKHPDSFVTIDGQTEKEYSFTLSTENSLVYIACEVTHKSGNQQQLVILDKKSVKVYAPTPSALTENDIAKTSTSIRITNTAITSKTGHKYRLRKKEAGSDSYQLIKEDTVAHFDNLTPNTTYYISYQISDTQYVGSSPYSIDFGVTTDTAFITEPSLLVSSPITSAQTQLNQVGRAIRYQVKPEIPMRTVFLIAENINPDVALSNVIAKSDTETGFFTFTSDRVPNGTYRVGILLSENRFTYSNNLTINWNEKIPFDGSIKLSGLPVVGSKLTAVSNSVNATSDIFQYQWYHAPNTIIDNATASTYIVKESDLGKRLLCKVTIKAAQHTIFAETEKSSSPTSEVSKAPAAPLAPYIPEKVEDADINKTSDNEVNNNESKDTKSVSSIFTDIVKDSWYEKSVQFVYEKGLMSGISKDNFAPEENASRGQIVTILYRLVGSPMVEGSTSFQDVMHDDYFVNAVVWATQNNITGGYGDSLFGAGDDITREQLAVFLYRLTQKNKITAESTSLESFTDEDMVSDYAKEAMNWAVAKGLINGVGNQTLNPKGNATRSQIATILMRYTELVK
ncbi:MAG: S-layer homology domain-containing protein [Eubacteriales bacterium]|nr:S-layer homology domain-containing protein [Eubacteriales bacterium]